jgi:hypothetical protein
MLKRSSAMVLLTFVNIRTIVQEACKITPSPQIFLAFYCPFHSLIL